MSAHLRTAGATTGGFGRTTGLFAVALEIFTRAGNREAFFVEQALDLENRFDVFAPVEAMAAVKPVIAIPAGVAAETVIDGKTGVLVAEQTAELA